MSSRRSYDSAAPVPVPPLSAFLRSQGPVEEPALGPGLVLDSPLSYNEQRELSEIISLPKKKVGRPPKASAASSNGKASNGKASNGKGKGKGKEKEASGSGSSGSRRQSGMEDSSLTETSASSGSKRKRVSSGSGVSSKKASLAQKVSNPSFASLSCS